MKVALGSIYPFDESHVVGGVEAAALYLAQALAQRDDIELHVVSCNRDIKKSFTEKRGTVTFHWLATGRRLSALRAATTDAWRVRRVYDEIQPDVIHTQGYSEYAVAARGQDRLIVTIQGVEAFVPEALRPLRHFQGALGVYRQWIGRWIAEVSLRRSSAIISTGGDYVIRLLGARIGPRPVYFIDNLIADDFFRPLPELISEDPIVFCAATIVQRKNILGLVRVFAKVLQRCPNARLLVAGAIGEQWYYARILEEIAVLGIGHKVELLGPLDQTQLIEKYNKSALFVMSSFHETTPLAIAQAMAIGKPVVATRVAGIPWMLQEGETGYLVDVNDVQGMADRIVELLLDGPRRIRMGQNAKGVARKRFAADVVAEKTVLAYRELIERIRRVD